MSQELAALQLRVLVGAAAEHLHVLAVGGADAMRLKSRLAELDLCATGRRTRSCSVLAEQIRLWYDAHSADKARALSQEAVMQHISATVFTYPGVRQSAAERLQRSATRTSTH